MPFSLIEAQAERISDVRNTRHNLSATVIPILPDGGERNAHAASESQVCAFCHTPHGATRAPRAPLWNRKLAGNTYIPYSSGSIDATDLGQPSGKSKLCLSCHDGTLALGSVNVLNGIENPDVRVIGPGVEADERMPEGRGETTGYTRRLGVNLTNDHPISFTYDAAQAARDGELVNPATSAHVRNRVRGASQPPLPLENDKVECISCHDPHIRDTSGENIKFLRVNRFQQAAPVEGRFDQQSDIICMGCHDKAGWAGSAHANVQVANERYTKEAAGTREFPQNMQVWQAACLNCHDPHTVQGSRRILREGTDGPLSVTAGGARYRHGGQPAIEETCYACHSPDGNTLQGQGPGSEVPDIKTDFTTKRSRMPISNGDQIARREMHDIGTGTLPQDGKDFIEAPVNMGKGDLNNRHAECTDCHNPHRVTKNRLFWKDPTVPDEEGTHNHSAAQVATNPEGHHTNIASGVLRGAFGIEPSGWPSTAFGSEPTVFDVKRGDPGVGGRTDKDAPYVTREYQVCLKCHSNYTYDTPPPLGYYVGGTPPGTNALENYTNQGMEFQSPEDHKGEGTPLTPTGVFTAAMPGECNRTYTSPTQGNSAPARYTNAPVGPGYLDKQGNCVNYVTDNHRSWHPVTTETGREAASVRTANPNVWLTPFNLATGVQTMYCTDCHGNETRPGEVTPQGGVNGAPWGPHGSMNNFILKGPWSDQTGTFQEDGLCFKCHDYNYYAKPVPLGTPDVDVGAMTLASGFRTDVQVRGCLGATNVNLHTSHTQAVNNFRCSYCHVAIPHGWKNKNFLVNLNDVGLEAGLPAGTQVRNNTTQRYYRGPYYNGSVLKVARFQRSGQWTPQSCGSAGAPGNGFLGQDWMNSGSETCRAIP